MAALPEKNNEAFPPSAPRFTGDAQADLLAISQWFNQFIQRCFQEAKLLDPQFHANTGDFEATGVLPDPTQTSLALAQLIANLAYQGQAATAVRFPVDPGSFTISETNDQATVTFSEELDDADYKVACQAVSYTGSPASGALMIASVEKEASGFTVTLSEPPGGGASVTYDFILMR